MTRKIVIDPVTRVEGHGKVTIHMDEEGNISESRFHIVEFRGFEKFVQGRPYWEAPVLVQRLCGICPVSHHLAAAKAIDQVMGLEPVDLTVCADKMRRLMHYGQVFQSHALHFFYLAAPDLLFGAKADPTKRNIANLLKEHRDFAVRGVKLRKFGQEIIKATAGKKIHGISAVPGGVHKHLSEEERKGFLADNDTPSIQTCIDWCQELIDFIQDYYSKNLERVASYCDIPSNHLSLVGKNGEMDLYHGALRVVDRQGKIILDDVDYCEYLDHFEEEVRDWTYLKFPYLKKLGPEKGWNHVGPLARLNVCDYIPTPQAQARLEKYRSFAGKRIVDHTLYFHWARLIEMLYCAEEMQSLLSDNDLLTGELISKGQRRKEGIGVIEAPRGTLLHHYEVSEQDEITRCNLIVSTTHNNQAMNYAVENVAERELKGKSEITEGMLNEIEVAIRAFDPCLSCATHAIGQMPLHIALYDHQNQLINQRFKE